MKFNVNHPILYVIVGAIILLVLAQSFFFLFRALKRAKQLGIASAAYSMECIFTPSINHVMRPFSHNAA